jgi:hypothetical protein
MASLFSKSIRIGWVIYFVILIIVFGPMLVGYPLPMTLNRVLLWQFPLIDVATGPHPILGYRENGDPIYEGTPIDGIIFFFGLGVGFIIYPALVYYFLLTRKWLDERITR